jgi:hypothetical protein
MCIDPRRPPSSGSVPVLRKRTHTTQIGPLKTIQSFSPQTVLRLSRETAQSAILLAYEALKPYDESWKAWPLQISWQLGRCAYWRRMWIVQEILLSRQLVVKFGVLEITWEQLEHFLDLSSAYSSNLEEMLLILPERYKESFERGRAAAVNIESLIEARRRWQQRVHTQEVEEERRPVHVARSPFFLHRAGLQRSP